MNTRKQMKLRTLQWYWDPFVRIDLMKRIYEHEGKVSYRHMNRRIRDMNIKILQKTLEGDNDEYSRSNDVEGYKTSKPFIK